MDGVACGRCGAIVGPGRLSCPACGSLLASVTGGAGQARVGSVPVWQPEAALESPLESPPESPRPPELSDAVEATSTVQQGQDGSPGSPFAAAGAEQAATPPVQAPAADSTRAVPGSYVARWSVPARFSRAVPAAAPATATPASSSRTLPPPVLATATPPVDGAAAPTVGTATPVAASSAAAGHLAAAGRAGLLADLPLDAPDDIPSWLVLIGSVVAVASFLLPWASANGIVLGTQGGTSYLDRWGLASLSDVALFIATLALLVLAVVPNRLPLRFRFGYLPIVLGGVDLGVAWVYIGLTFGYGTGIVVLLFGAVLLIAGSSLALRHPSGPPGV